MLQDHLEKQSCHKKHIDSEELALTKLWKGHLLTHFWNKRQSGAFAWPRQLNVYWETQLLPCVHVHEGPWQHQEHWLRVKYILGSRHKDPRPMRVRRIVRVQFLQSKSKGCPPHYLISLGWSGEGIKGKAQGMQTNRTYNWERIWPAACSYRVCSKVRPISGVQKGAKDRDLRKLQNDKLLICLDRMSFCHLLHPPKKLVFFPLCFGCTLKNS